MRTAAEDLIGADRRDRRGAFVGAVGPVARRGALLALVAAAFAAPAQASGDGSTTDGSEGLASTGYCTEVALAMSVPSGPVRDEVPSRFEVIEDAFGMASVAVFGEKCALAAGEDQPSEDSYLFGTFTRVRDSEGAGRGAADVLDPPNYDFSWTTTDRAYHSKLRTLGFGELVPGAIFESDLADGEFTGVVPGGAMPFSFEGRAQPAPRLPEADESYESTHWSAGSGQRFVRCDYDHDFTRLAPAEGTVRADPRSPLARMIGDQPAQASGVLAEFHFSGNCHFA